MGIEPERSKRVALFETRRIGGSMSRRDND
jgi:hypothetical protein